MRQGTTLEQVTLYETQSDIMQRGKTLTEKHKIRVNRTTGCFKNHTQLTLSNSESLEQILLPIEAL